MDKIGVIFNQIIKEAKTGKIIVGENIYNIQFDVLNENELGGDFNPDIPILIIRDFNNLISLLERYLNVLFKVRGIDNPTDNDIKLYSAYLWCNASFTDFCNPEAYISKCTNFFLDDKFMVSEKLIENVTLFDGNSVKCKRELVTYRDETPYVFTTSVIGSDDSQTILPQIYYGIDGDTCYIYGVQYKNNEENNLEQNRAITKKTNRQLYKVNGGVYESDEYLEYKTGASDYYPENISDVSVSCVFVLGMLLSELAHSGINDVRVVSYLPIRNIVRNASIEKRLAHFKEKLSKEEYEEYLFSVLTKEQDIANNLTQKFLRNFYRLSYHFDNILVINDPFELDEYMHVRLNSFEKDYLGFFVNDDRKKRGL